MILLAHNPAHVQEAAVGWVLIVIIAVIVLAVIGLYSLFTRNRNRR